MVYCKVRLIKKFFKPFFFSCQSQTKPFSNFLHFGFCINNLLGTKVYKKVIWTHDAKLDFN